MPSRGFTLIELLVSIGILISVFSLGFAGYRDYSRRQEMASISRQLRADLRWAQSLALSGHKPTADYLGAATSVCQSANPLIGYNLQSSANSYRIRAVCNQAGTAQFVIIKNTAVPSYFTLTGGYNGGSPVNPSGYFVFKPLGQGTNLSPQAAERFTTITDTRSGAQETILITSSGEVK